MYLNLDRSRANKISKVCWGDGSLGKNICFVNMKTRDQIPQHPCRKMSMVAHTGRSWGFAGQSI